MWCAWVFVDGKWIWCGYGRRVRARACLEERLPLPDGEGLQVEDEPLPGEGLLREGGLLYMYAYIGTGGGLRDVTYVCVGTCAQVCPYLEPQRLVQFLELAVPPFHQPGPPHARHLKRV